MKLLVEMRKTFTNTHTRTHKVSKIGLGNNNDWVYNVVVVVVPI